MGTEDRGIKILFGSLILIILVGTLVGGTTMGPGMMGSGMMWGYGNPGAPATAGSWTWGLSMALGMAIMLAFWAALIVGAVLLVRWAIDQSPRASGGARPDDPREILRRRYAAGEIDRATYQRIMAELDGDAEPYPREAAAADGLRR